MSPKIKYDNTGIEDLPDQQHAPVGTYRAKIKTAELKESKAGNDMIELMMLLTHDASGTKLKEDFAPIWYYPIMGHDHPFVQARWKEFIAALGLKPKGELDVDKIVGKNLQVKLKSDTDQDGDYRPSVRNVMAPDSASADEDEPEPDEPEEDEPEAEEESEDLNDAIADLDRTELKAFIKDNELGSLADLGITRKTTDDEIREKIVEAWPEDEDEPEDEPEPEAEDEPEPEPEGDEPEDNYDDLKVPDLKKELAERELPTNGSRAILIKRLRADDGTDPF